MKVRFYKTAVSVSFQVNDEKIGTERGKRQVLDFLFYMCDKYELKRNNNNLSIIFEEIEEHKTKIEFTYYDCEQKIQSIENQYKLNINEVVQSDKKEVRPIESL